MDSENQKGRDGLFQKASLVTTAIVSNVAPPNQSCPPSTRRVLTFPLPLARHQNLHNPLRRMPIPLFRDQHGPARPVQDGLGRRQDFFLVIADQDVGAFFAGDGAFGVMAQGDAGYAEDGGFFLQAAAVGEHQSGGHVEMEEFQVAEGIGQPDAGAVDAFPGLTVKESPNIKPEPLPVPPCSISTTVFKLYKMFNKENYL